MRKESNKSKKTTIYRIVRLITTVFANIFLLFVIFQSESASAQERTSLSENFGLSLAVKNMHLWHGGVVTPGAMFASAIEYHANKWEQSPVCGACVHWNTAPRNPG